MGQVLSLKSERKTHDLNHDLTFYAHTIDCIQSMFRVLGMYNFDTRKKIIVSKTSAKFATLTAMTNVLLN